MLTHSRRSSARLRPFLLSLVLLVGLALPVSASSPPLAIANNGVSARRVMQWAMGSQRRMLQVATIGMCFALWIMMKK